MTHTYIIEPDTYTPFADEAEQMEKCKEWGLLSEKASKSKAFYYKGNGLNVACSVVGYIDNMTAVIELDNNVKHCIHPSYLKEMQAANYGVKQSAVKESESATVAVSGTAAESKTVAEASDKTEEPAVVDQPATEEPVIGEIPSAEPAKTAEAAEPEPSKEKAKKGKSQKLQLPEEKVKMTATVKEFTTVPNHFSDNDDEVIIYEPVAIVEPEIDLGTAWSSHSATLKKLELVEGDMITFEAKIVAKKLTKHPVPYKINNPAKIQKQ